MEPLGDRALLAVLGEAGLPGVIDLVPAYATLAVNYDPGAWAGASPPYPALAGALARLWADRVAAAVPAPRLVELPVCYGGEFGPDLAETASHCGLSEADLIARHAGAEYRVYMLGFAPGFPYLGGLDPAIAAPRRATPRLKVPAGSVGIAGMQTGIYPLETPGGWQIIGRTPRRLFLPAQEEPCLLRPGDRLRFVPIGPEAYLAFDGDRP
jgi:inhibitor of KinA